MIALPLFDVVMSSRTPERSSNLAGQLVAAALHERDQIEKFDGSVAPNDPLEFDRQTAALVRGMYEQWARDAESLLNRVAAVEKRYGAVAAADSLRDAVGRTLAMLSISLDDMEAATQDIVQGRLHSLEEVRRELRLAVH